MLKLTVWHYEGIILMKLKKVDGYSVFESTVHRFKAGFPKGSVSDNCYLLPDKIASICSEGRLYQISAQSLEHLAFLADEGSFYRLYLFMQGQGPLDFDVPDKPVLAEVLYLSLIHISSYSGIQTEGIRCHRALSIIRTAHRSLNIIREMDTQ